MSCALTLALFACLLVLGYAYVRKCFAFWRARGVPSTSPRSVVGDIGASLFGFTNIAFVHDAIYRRFGDAKVVGMYEFLTPNLLVRDPQLIATILATDFSHFCDRFADAAHVSRLDYHLFVLNGREWRAVRQRLVRAFTGAKLTTMLPMVDDCAKAFSSLLRQQTQDGESFDAKEMGARFATDVIGHCMFGLDFQTLHDPHSEFRRIGKLMLAPNIKIPLLQLLRFFAPKFLQFFKISENPPEMEPFFVQVLRRSEQDRRQKSSKRNDLMQLILSLREEAQLDDGQAPDGSSLKDNVILSNMFIFYAAAYETTSATLSYCLYELALHPQMQQRLRSEILTALPTAQAPLTLETLKNMKYMEMVLLETLRKYSPAPFLNRICTQPFRLPGTSTTLRPGMRVTIPVYSVHRDERYYPHPDQFDPQRFTPENINARPPFTFLPFGEGPRKCIAGRFDKIEIKVCLARLLESFEFSTCAETTIPIETEPRSFLKVPKNGIRLKVERLQTANSRAKRPFD